MKRLILILFLFALNQLLSAQELPADANTTLLLHFNGNVNGAQGEKPIIQKGLSYGPGKFGSCLQISNSNFNLTYTRPQNIKSTSGTIEFWAKGGRSDTVQTIIGLNVTGGMRIDLGNWSGLFMNIGGTNQPEVSVTAYGVYRNDAWNHYAFTWGNKEYRMYMNGKLLAKTESNILLPNIGSSYFSIGQDIHNNYLFKNGSIEELRISDKVRTDTELLTSYLKGIRVDSLIVFDTSTIKLYKDWRLYLTKQFETVDTGLWKSPKIIVKSGNNYSTIPNSFLSWYVQDTNIIKIIDGYVLAKNVGESELYGFYSDIRITIPIEVKYPIKLPDKETNIDPFLTKVDPCSAITIPVIVLCYLPTNDGTNLNFSETGSNIQYSIPLVKSRMQGILKQSKYMLQEGTKFRGYKSGSAKPYINYKVIDYLYFYEPLPRGFPQPKTNRWFPDYHQMFEKINLRNYVENLGVKEVWLFQYDAVPEEPIEIALNESNMASPHNSDISNSLMTNDDMPIYKNTYVLYGYNFNREGNEATHNHGHQIEYVCKYIDQKQNGNHRLFDTLFMGIQPNGKPSGRCGNTHFPPNALFDYDWYNINPVVSDIADWKPDGTGTKTPVNANTWGNIPYNFPNVGFNNSQPDAQTKWYVFWMQSIPGFGNNIQYGKNYLSNWWKLIYQWDLYYNTLGLTQSKPEAPQFCSSCFDDIRNGDEVGIDCGAECTPCTGCYDPQLISLGTMVTQSSNFDTLNSFPASKLVDGTVISTNYNSTSSEMFPWIQIDLGVGASINKIVIANRLGCLTCYEKIQYFNVYISNTPINDFFDPSYAYQYSNYPGLLDGQILTIANLNSFGRYIKIWAYNSKVLPLSFSEVSVYGCLSHEALNRPKYTKPVRDNEFSFIAYPNPTTNELNIDIKGDSEFYSLEIRDISGKLIYHSSRINQFFKMPLYDYVNGMYILSVRDRTQTKFFKIIKQK